MTAFRIVDKETVSNGIFDFGGCSGSLCGPELAGDSFAVASGRLFWGSRSYTYDPYETTHSFIRSCVVDHCASSLITYVAADSSDEGFPPDGQYFQTDIRPDTGLIYWKDVYSSIPGPFVYSPIDAHVAAANITVPGTILTTNFVVDNGLLYSVTTDATLLRCGISDCTNSLAQFPVTFPAVSTSQPMR